MKNEGSDNITHTIKSRMKTTQTYRMAMGCIILTVAALLAACQAIYEDLTYCPQNLVVNFSADEASECSRAEGDRYSYDLSRMQQLSVGIYRKNDGKLLRVQNVSPTDLMSQQILFDKLPEGEYVISAWTSETSSPEIYNTDAGKSFPWKPDVESVAQYDRVLPRIFHATAEYSLVAKPDSGTVDEHVRLNFEPYSQQFNFRLRGLEAKKTYTLKWMHTKPERGDSFGRELLRPTTYIRTFTTDAKGQANVNLSMLKSPSENDGLLTFTYEGKNVMEPITFDTLLGRLESASGGNHLPVECLETVPVDMVFDLTTDMAVHITILHWYVLHRRVILGI